MSREYIDDPDEDMAWSLRRIADALERIADAIEVVAWPTKAPDRELAKEPVDS